MRLSILTARKILILIFLISFVAGFSLLFQNCNENNPDTSKINHLHSKWLNTDSSASYVGMEECRKCHEDIYQSFRQTGMGQSFGTATRIKSAADFAHAKPLYDKYLDFYYQPYWDGNSLMVKEYRLSSGDTVFKRAEKVDYIVGSGHHTNSHIVNENGYLYQAPFTWYSQMAKLDFPPGFENGYNSRFSRALGAECLTCHNAYPKFVEGSLNKYTYVPEGIDCERCHGPGSIHVKTKVEGKIVNTKKDTDFTIVNPAKLAYRLQIDVCQRCHAQGNSVLKPGKTFFDFRPGTTLSSVMDVFFPVYENQETGFLMASHPDRLRKSHCFVKSNKSGSGKSLTCVTCHNPHISVKLTPVEYYISKCSGCHPDSHRTDPELLNQPGKNCITCHMPKSSAIDIPHVTITDHFIRVVNKQPEKNEVIGVGKFKGLQCLTSEKPDEETLARAYLYFFEKFEHRPEMLDSAMRHLKFFQPETKPDLYIAYYYLSGNFMAAADLVRKEKSTFSAAITNYQAGQCFVNIGNPNFAVRYMKAAVELEPYNLDYRLKLATTYVEVRDIEHAEKEFVFVKNENPKIAAAWNGLAFIELVKGNFDKAESNLTSVFRLDPDYVPGHINHAKLLMAQNRVEQAKAELKLILKKDKNNTEAKTLLELIKREG